MPGALYPTYVHFLANRSVLLITGWVVVNLLWFAAFYALRYQQAVYNNVFGRAIAHVNLLNLGLLLLPVSRGSPLLAFLRLPFEKAVFYHRLFARTMIFTVLLHALSWAFYWTFASPSRNELYCSPVSAAYSRTVCESTTWAFLFDGGGLVAAGSLLCFLVIAVLALEPVRVRAFELFYYSHHLFLLGILLALVHSMLAQVFVYGFLTDLSILYLLPGILLYSYDRVVRFRRSRLVNRELIALKPYHVKSGVTVLEVHRDELAFQPGQYCFLCVPSLSRLQWHPYSISSAPGSSILTFHIKSMGPGTWSQQVNDVANELVGEVGASLGNISLTALTFHDALEVKIDGPYGVGFSLEELQSRRHSLLVCGGIGITPVAAMLRTLLAAEEEEERRRRRGGGTGERGLAEMSLELVWVVKKVEQVLWFSDLMYDLADLQASHPGAVRLQVFVSSQPLGSCGTVVMPKRGQGRHVPSSLAVSADSVVDESFLDRWEEGEDSAIHSHSFRDYSSFTQRLLQDPETITEEAIAEEAEQFRPVSPSDSLNSGPLDSEGEVKWTGGRPDLYALFSKVREKVVREELEARGREEKRRGGEAKTEAQEVDVWTLVCGPQALEQSVALHAHELSAKVRHGDQEVLFSFSFTSLTFQL